jgi:hypothetical protein
VRLSSGEVIQIERRERYRLPAEVLSLRDVSGAGDLHREESELRLLSSSAGQLPVLKMGDGSASEVPLIFDVDVADGNYFAITAAAPEHSADTAHLGGTLS